MKNYIVSEERLLELLENEARLQCLENDGVDNWMWYMEGRKRFIADALCISEEEVEDRDLDFKDLALADIKDFKEV